MNISYLSRYLFFMKHTDITNIALLANFLSIEKTILKGICDNEYEIIESRDSEIDNETDQIDKLKRIEILKKDGSHRIVYAPFSDTLINCLKILNKQLSSIYKPPSNVHGFVKGKSIKTNAFEHLSKNYILKVDIKNYFESITCEIIEEHLIKLKFTPEISSAIAKIGTYNNSLIQGFHTSPTIANIIFYDIDILLSKIDSEITYSRYSDDLYFSSDKDFEIVDKIKNILSRFGFTLNRDKTIVMKRGQKQYVTGLTVFDSIQPRISKRVKRSIRQKLYYIQKFGYKGHIMHTLGITNEEYLEDENIKDKVDLQIEYLKKKMKGWLVFINSIEPNFSDKYLNAK